MTRDQVVFRVNGLCRVAPTGFQNLQERRGNRDLTEEGLIFGRKLQGVVKVATSDEPIDRCGEAVSYATSASRPGRCGFFRFMSFLSEHFGKPQRSAIA